MTFLLDTNVLLELRRGRGKRADPNVLSWASEVAVISFYISVVNLMELEMGVLRANRRDRSQATALRNWLQNDIRPTFLGRIIPFDEPVALRCAALHVLGTRSNRDAMIAATALVHGMTVVTRNTADFDGMDVALLNPWDASAAP